MLGGPHSCGRRIIVIMWVLGPAQHLNPYKPQTLKTRGFTLQHVASQISPGRIFSCFGVSGCGNKEQPCESVYIDVVVLSFFGLVVDGGNKTPSGSGFRAEEV